MPSDKKNGFSLIEVLAGIAILAFAILGVMAVLPHGYRHITNSGRMATMNHLAQLKMDQLRALSWNDSDLLDGIHPSTGMSETFPEVVPFTDSDGNSIYADYSLEWNVDVDEPETNMKLITVTVGYQLYDDAGAPIASTDTTNQLSARFQTYINR